MLRVTYFFFFKRFVLTLVSFHKYEASRFKQLLWAAQRVTATPAWKNSEKKKKINSFAK